MGPETVQRARAHPGARLILAHCAIGAFEQVIHDVDDVPNLFFDTSWWNPADVWALFRMVPPGRILYASDIPFASTSLGNLLNLKDLIHDTFLDGLGSHYRWLRELGRTDPVPTA